MLAKRRSYAIQDRYRQEGRVGKHHPAHNAARVSRARRQLRAQRENEALERERLGLRPKPRSKLLPHS